MAKTYQKDAGTCPFWSTQSTECRICKNGLFIPLDNHIEVYCKTTDYVQCLQYGLHPENRLQRVDKTEQSKNRRKYERVEANLKVTLVKYIHSGEIGSHCSAFAKTMDLSCGGMRLTTNKPLPNDSIVMFSFDNSFGSTLKECSGKVAWCNKAIDHPGYQAGITFRDDNMIKAMNSYLDSVQSNA